MTAQATYELHLLNYNNDVVAVFSGAGRRSGGLEAFSYRKRLRTEGGITVMILGDDERIQSYLRLPESLDYTWRFYREDPLAPEFGRVKDFEGFHRHENIVRQKDGLTVYISRGQGLNSLLYSEIIYYPPGSIAANAFKTGEITQVAKSYIDEAIGPLAGTDSAGYSRVRPWFQTGYMQNSGKIWQPQQSLRNMLLADGLDALANQANAEYMIENDAYQQFTLSWKIPIWGRNRLPGNPQNNPPTVFSVEYGNISTIDSRYSFLDDVNVLYIHGAGVQDSAVSTTVVTPDHLTQSPWSRRAIYRARLEELEVPPIQQWGEALLREKRPLITFSLEVLQTKSTRYIRDWDIGDAVAVQDPFGRLIPAMIRGVTVTLSKDGSEALVPEFEELYPAQLEILNG